jgi:hypothetical protein
VIGSAVMTIRGSRRPAIHTARLDIPSELLRTFAINFYRPLDRVLSVFPTLTAS